MAGETTENIDEVFDEDDPKITDPAFRNVLIPMDIRTNMAASATIVLLSTLLNAIVLNIYKRRKKDMSTKFVVALACLDIASCWLLRSLDIARTLVMGSHQTAAYVLSYAYALCFGFIVSTYTLLLLTWALERLVAVACPFTFREKLEWFRPALLVVAIANTVLALANSVVGSSTQPSTTTRTTILALTLSVAFIKIAGTVAAFVAIVVIIKRTDKKMAAKRGVGGEAQQSARSSRHKRSVKVCMYLLLVYIATYGSFYVSALGIVERQEFLLVYFLDHIANFFVYCATDEKFRADLERLFTQS